MGSCQCQGIEEVFGSRYAERDLERYRRRGPSRTTRLLIEALAAHEIRGLTLLDIGGGVGAVQHELLRRGVRCATDVDASRAYLAAAKREAVRLGHADMIRHHHGNFVDLAETIEPADIVTLDRVICCYDDMPALVGLSVDRARILFAAVYPRESFWLRMGLAATNLWGKLMRCSYRTFLHATGAVHAEIERRGMRLDSRAQTPVWQVVVYVRGCGRPSRMPRVKRRRSLYSRGDDPVFGDAGHLRRDLPDRCIL